MITWDERQKRQTKEAYHSALRERLSEEAKNHFKEEHEQLPPRMAELLVLLEGKD